EARDLGRELAAAAARRERAGDLGALDVSLAAVEASKADQAFELAGAERLRALDRLAVAIGAAPGEELEAADDAGLPGEPPPGTEAALSERALAARADLAAARTDRARLEDEAALVKRRGEVPNPVLRAFYRRELLNEEIVGGEITVPLPVWNREQGTET